MIPELRRQYNSYFTTGQYEKFLARLNEKHPGAIEFRVAETPVFVPLSFKKQMIDTCETIIDLLLDPQYPSLTERSIPEGERVPGENGKSRMIVFDFGVCMDPEGGLQPQLIELQGFPSLYAFQVYYPDLLRQYFPIPGNFSQYLHSFDTHSYLEQFARVVLGKHNPENVILLEIKPHEQKTKIDFYCTRDYLGIQPVCITELIQEGKKLYYMRDGRKIPVHRIYNRVIFDDLKAKADTLGPHIDITQEFDVEWVPHPNWFYRISKFTLPYISHPNVPRTFFLNEVKQIPGNLENFVLKPLFSFAGQGVIIDATENDIHSIRDPWNWILQEKVKYADAIQTPGIPAKAEIRIMYLWPDEAERPFPAINLARLSKGKMIGVRYNKDMDWVGGSVCYFER